ncbi:MAG: ATP-dependent DNA helicase RecG [Acidimicrobiales bacterium]|nr:ATP-dependent DNA helicase RecG [Acidimicrobiales bacterium]
MTGPPPTPGQQVRVTSLSKLAGIGVDELRGVGAKHAEALGVLGIETVLDLVTFYPRRYLDRTNQAEISELAEGEQAMVLATIKKVTSRRTRQGRMMVEADLFDGTSYLHLSFFNQPWRAKQLREATPVIVFGKVERFRGRWQMTNPVVDLVGDRTGRIVPVYPQSEKAGLMTWQLADWVAEALRRVPAFDDPLPRRWRDELDLAGRDWALRHIHQPETVAAAQKARGRLAFDELLRLQVVLVMRKRAVERDAVGIRHQVDGELVERFRDSLPFPLTGAQETAIAEIAVDMAGPHPMHRLLQGDVGSGKTVVAVAALLTAVQGGHQGALMAPTEVLAEQHHTGISELLRDLSVPSDQTLFSDRPVQVALLTNRTTAAERTRLLARLEDGTADILVGTHALLTEKVAFTSLGCVVIDEQHRFGVEQRAALREKGPGEVVPDVLVMTATPIPRTAAMTVYGDLDTTVLGELPPGRTPVTTRWARGPVEEASVWRTVLEQIAAGHQAYVVCPLVEDSEKVQARSASEERDRLAVAELAGVRLGLLHGQMPARDKEQEMEAFRNRETDVLVSTTVIEVGVDVPNATVMVIEDADRFGIAQLHQLRGRVGRGSDQSWCFLLGEGRGPESEERLVALERSTDGFELAEVDLELRGEGTILGTRQKGATDLKLASLRRDKQLVATARQVAFALVDEYPGLEGLPELADEIGLLLDEEDRAFLFKS